jgi:hypothetical protein
LTARYARLLVEYGYQTDCSVTPFVSWTNVKGAPNRAGGCDFTGFPSRPYFLDLHDISREGDSPLLEAPVTIVRKYRFAQPIEDHLPLVRRFVGRAFPAVVWMRPTQWNRRFLIELLRRARGGNAPYVQFMLHSSELMPGGSPTFRNAASVEKLYEDLEALFETAAGHFRGATLREFREAWAARADRVHPSSSHAQFDEAARSPVGAD